MTVQFLGQTVEIHGVGSAPELAAETLDFSGWIGPFLEDVLRKEISKGKRTFVVAPIGFLMDHLEVLYDVDVVANRVAADAGAELVRTPMPNDDPLFIEMLVDVILQTVRRDQVQLDMGFPNSE